MYTSTVNHHPSKEFKSFFPKQKNHFPDSLVLHQFRQLPAAQHQQYEEFLATSYICRPEVRNAASHVRYENHEDSHEYDFISSLITAPAKDIADIYKERWKVETFFRFIKQNLKI